MPAREETSTALNRAAPAAGSASRAGDGAGVVLWNDQASIDRNNNDEDAMVTGTQPAPLQPPAAKKGWLRSEQLGTTG